MRTRMIDVRYQFARETAGVFKAGALAGALLCGAPVPLAAQEVPVVQRIWVARENPANLTDESVENVTWEGEVLGEYRRYVFATGFVTRVIPNTTQTYTQFATYKYRADWPEQGGPLVKEGEAFYPEFPPTSPETNKATGIAVDVYGNVYVTGMSQRPGGTDMDIVVIKYDKDLVPDEDWLSTGSGPGVRRHDFINGDDIPTDIAIGGLDPMAQTALAVVAIGTSWGGLSGRDLVSLAFDARDGTAPEVAWPNQGFGDGVRRYHHGPEDRAVEVDGVTAFKQQPTDEIGNLEAVVLGTSYDPVTQDDYVIIFYGEGINDPIWEKRYDPSSGANDVATGLDVYGTGGGTIVATGYAPPPDGEGGMMSFFAPENVDYLTVAFLHEFFPPNPHEPIWEQRWDYQGEGDYPADVLVVPPHVLVTGRANRGMVFDAGTIVLPLDTGDPPLFVHAFGAPASDERGQAIEMGSAFSIFVAGMVGAGPPTSFNALVWKYRYTGLQPPNGPWVFHWGVAYDGGGSHDEARDLSVMDINGFHNVYPTGTSVMTGQGQDCTLIRYKQTLP